MVSAEDGSNSDIYPRIKNGKGRWAALSFPGTSSIWVAGLKLASTLRVCLLSWVNHCRYFTHPVPVSLLSGSFQGTETLTNERTGEDSWTH